MMFFAILVALFFARQAGTHMDPRTHEQIGDWHPVLLPPILFLNTAVLLLSSLTIEIARAISSARLMCWRNGWASVIQRCSEPCPGWRNSRPRALFLAGNGSHGSS